MQQAFEFYLPTRILFACGARRKLPDQLARLGIKEPAALHGQNAAQRRSCGKGHSDS